jgi:hypothetical protein
MVTGGGIVLTVLISYAVYSHAKKPPLQFQFAEVAAVVPSTEMTVVGTGYGDPERMTVTLTGRDAAGKQITNHYSVNSPRLPYRLTVQLADGSWRTLTRKGERHYF